MIKDILKITAFVLLVAFLSALFSFLIVRYIPSLFSAPVGSEGVFDGTESRLFIIDPGHGGEDPGAVGTDGIIEKDLNLSVANKIKALLEFEGKRTLMTRESDIMLYDKNGSGSRKGQDLKNRLEIGNSHPDGVFVSVHMNKFPQEYCRGVQIYYSANDSRSIEIARSLCDAVKSSLQPDNNREIKRADSSIYILNNINIPAVLIECGFISNREEAKLLCDSSYQDYFGAIISDALSEGVNFGKDKG